RQLTGRRLHAHPPDDLARHVVTRRARPVAADVEHVAVGAGGRVPLDLAERPGPVPSLAAGHVDRAVLARHVGLVVRVVGTHVARVAGLRLAGLLQAERVARVAGDAAVPDLEARGVDVLLLLVAPVPGVGGAGLRVAGVAPHLHDLAGHLLVVGDPDVALPVDAEAARAGAVGVAGVGDVLLVDLGVAGAAGRLRHPPLGRHDLVVVRAVAVGAADLRKGVLHPGVLDARPTHRARLELLGDGRVRPGVAGRAGLRIEHPGGDVGPQPGRRRRHPLHVLEDGADLPVAHRLAGERRHDRA